VLHGGRGRILDRHEQTLARSITKGQLWVDVRHLKQKEYAIATLAWDECRSEPEWADLSIKEQNIKRREAISRLKLHYTNRTVELEKRYLAYAIDYLAPVMAIQHDEFYAAFVEKIALNDYFYITGKGELNQREGATRENKSLPPLRTNPVWMDDDTCNKIQDTLDKNKIFGFKLLKAARREYVSPEFATHVIGYTETQDQDKENTKFGYQVGKYGIEGKMDDFIQGKDGYRKCITNPSGEIIGKNTCVTKLPVHGNNVVLTLDTSIQNIAQEELNTAITEFQAKQGCVIVMDPHTGEILAMANCPFFHQMRLDETVMAGTNFATQYPYEPGSIMKIVAFSAALDQNEITRSSRIDCHNGTYRGDNYQITEKYARGFLEAEWVIGLSSNLGTIEIANQIGTKKYFEYLEKFGLGVKTEIELKGEKAGDLMFTKSQRDNDHKTFGYNLKVTPFQMANVYSVIANGGKLMKPTLIKAIVANDGALIQKNQPKVLRQVISANAASEARLALKTVTNKKGTGFLANVAGHEVCGKTGTSKKIKTEAERKADPHSGPYSEKLQYCSFVGMLPVNDPKFVCMVFIDEPKAPGISHDAGIIAAPVFSRVCARVAEHLHIAPTVAIPPHVADQ
jgi:cell division protein FtsI (penicillin-binding protein 3)